jgi:hypothetical protein
MKSIYKSTMKATNDNLLRMYPIFFIINIIPLAFLFLQTYVTTGRWVFSVISNTINMLKSIDTIIPALAFFNIYIVFVIFISLELVKHEAGESFYNKQLISRFMGKFNNLILTTMLTSFYIIVCYTACAFVTGALQMVWRSPIPDYIKWVAFVYLFLHLVFTYLYAVYEDTDPITSLKKSITLARSNIITIVLSVFVLYLPFLIIDVTIGIIQDPKAGAESYVWIKKNVHYIMYLVTPLKMMILSFGIFYLYKKCDKSNHPHVDNTVADDSIEIVTNNT